MLLRTPELVDQTALNALQNGGRVAFLNARTFPELGAQQAYYGDPHRATPMAAENLYAALEKFVAEESAFLLRS